MRFRLNAAPIVVALDARRWAPEIGVLLAESGGAVDPVQIVKDLDAVDIERTYLLLFPCRRLVGMIVARIEPDDKTIRLTDLVVHPDYRRAGLGRMLLERAVADYGTVVFDVAPDNVASLALVRGMGAEEES